MAAVRIGDALNVIREVPWQCNASEQDEKAQSALTSAPKLHHNNTMS